MAEILLGSHVGMSGKEMFLGSVKEAESYGANVLMVYTGAPQNTRRKEIGELRIDEGISYAEKAGIREIVIHAPYIINLGNMEKPEMFDFGVEFLAKEVKRAAAFHSKVLVLHPGSSLPAMVSSAILTSLSSASSTRFSPFAICSTDASTPALKEEPGCSTSTLL